MRTELALVLALTVAACGGGPGTVVLASPATPQHTVKKSASLLKRLGEAADGYRDGVDRFVVAAREFPHQVAGVFLTKPEADSVAADSSTSTIHYEVFGPYRTATEAGVSAEIDDVDSVVAYLKDNTTRTYDGDEYDALFWTLPAFDKFVAPYLTSSSSAERADSLREAYKQGQLTNSPLGHKRDSF
jgi:hypothetical protein